ncbi:MAG: RCC1 repeat-containing protein [Deltaproteobacteria bacterium]|nr:RCC1 repeat-containing protein [Deltaproteobacteria bacterium]
MKGRGQSLELLGAATACVVVSWACTSQVAEPDQDASHHDAGSGCCDGMAAEGGSIDDGSFDGGFDGSDTDAGTDAAITQHKAIIVAVGGAHTCALTSEGGVKCWGSNYKGQLGIGAATNQESTPVDVLGLTSGVKAVTARSSHTCALTSAGGVKCWGQNDRGQLGNGTTTYYYPTSTPVDVLGLTSGVKAVSAGYKHTCAVTSAGGVKCWGENEYGQLGDGTSVGKSTPVDVLGLTSVVKAVTAGGDHTCALTDEGGVKCWGANDRGQLGNGTTTYRESTPVDVFGLTSGAMAVTAGSSHTCAVTSAGGVKCWGMNVYGGLGDGTQVDKSTPVDVLGLTSGAMAASAGGGCTCAVTNGGGVKCWGYNYYGQLGDGTYDDKSTPVDVLGLTSGVMAATACGNHTCAVTNGGGVKCWGENTTGQLGIGTATYQESTPVDVLGLTSGAMAVTACEGHTCAVTNEGGVKCWGINLDGQLGDGTTRDRSTPVDVLQLTSGVMAATAGGDYTCAVTTSGGINCWGNNEHGQLGDGTSVDKLTPVDVLGLSSGVKAVTAGFSHTCALTSAGAVKCWGGNSAGQLGIGTATYQESTPVDVLGLTSGAMAVTAGGSHT